MKKLVTILLIALTFRAIAQKPVATDQRFNRLNTAFTLVLKSWNAAGFSVAVIKKNKVVYAKGFGYRDISGFLPAI